jgi:hypothetical protein
MGAKVPTKEDILRRCDIASKIVLKYGPIWSREVPEQEIEEFVEDGEYMGISSITNHISSKNVKWYIHNKVTTDDPIWNADFFAGLTRAGKINWNQKLFPTFTWRGAPAIAKALEGSPFFGTLSQYKDRWHSYTWSNSPVLCVKSSNKTMSYLAGLLCTGKLYKKNGFNYVYYKDHLKEELESLGINIEVEGNKRPIISPFWPALLSKFMPPECRDYWLNVKKPYRADEYAAILWATHASHDIIRGGLPFLQCRRKVFYKFKHEDGTLKELQRKRLECGLVDIDARFDKCIASWISNA